MTPRRSPLGDALLVLAALVAGLIGGAIVVLVDGGNDDDGGSEPSAQTGALTTARDAPAAGSAAERVYARANESVVFVSARVTQASTSPFGTEQSEGLSTGTGFVIESDGTIVTNAHVVEGADEVTVRVGGGDARAARIVGSDPSTDIALLRAEGGGARPLRLADSDAVVVGESAFAIGNPYGLDRTLTSGVISALQRQITAPNGFSISGVIQTDTPINPGNSGGPLLDADAEAIGITSQIITGSSSGESGGNVGIGFAVPSNTVRAVVAQLERDGTAEHAYLGAQTTDATGEDGALVAAVVAGGPAARAGLRVGDVVTGLGGERVEDSAELISAINAHQPGDRVRVAFQRDGARRTVTVTLGEQPASATTGTGGTP